MVIKRGIQELSSNTEESEGNSTEEFEDKSWTLYVLIIEQKISENIDETVVETLTKYM
uniref:Uncharacterized protein n=1 Tax=Rhizophagus irregularis (strain DAOM 181602 / DAOM 197198 / MUCL 43194) TaxID=747089 RepID=U9TL80_RHIID